MKFLKYCMFGIAFLIPFFALGQTISLNQFEVLISNNYLIVKWEIGDTLVNQPFEIQRSTDGVLFETIGVENISNSPQYEYIDSSAKGYYPILCYRLRQKQTDLFALYSPIFILQKVNISSPEPLIYPNPVSDLLSLNYSPDGGQGMFVRIADQIGRIIYESPRMSNVHIPQWEVSKLATGKYYLIIITQTEIKTVAWIKL